MTTVPAAFQLLFFLLSVQLILDDSAEIHQFFANALLKTTASVWHHAFHLPPVPLACFLYPAPPQIQTHMSLFASHIRFYILAVIYSLFFLQEEFRILPLVCEIIFCVSEKAIYKGLDWRMKERLKQFSRNYRLNGKIWIIH